MDNSFSDKLINSLVEDDHTNYTPHTNFPSTTTTPITQPSSTINGTSSFEFNQKGFTLQGFRCPDCPSDTTSCVGCFRFETNFKTNIPINPPQKVNLFKKGTICPIQPACYNCPNHPINGGSGNCNCTLGTEPIIC